MNEDLITEELARLLPDIKCTNINAKKFYSDNLGLCELSNDGEMLLSSIKGLLYDVNGDFETGFIYAAPELFILQKWLMKNHNIYVLVELDETTDPKFVYIVKHYKNNTWINVLKYNYSDLFLDYNQCLNEGLLEAVKYIKNERTIN